MTFDREKFKALAHYVCWKCQDDPSRLGAVKLNKSLWLADFAAYYQTGEPLTGARYVKRQFGPVPSAILSVLAELEREGAIRITERELPGSYRQRQFLVLQAPQPGTFDAEELALIDKVIKTVCEEHTARSISEKTHDHVWKAAEIGEEIPYFTIFAVPGEITEDEREWARSELESMLSGSY